MSLFAHRQLGTRPDVLLVSPQDVVQDPQDHNSTIHCTRPIHSRSVDKQSRRKEREDDGKQCVHGSHDVDRDASSPQSPRSKVDSFVAQSLANHEDDRDEIRG